jgi:hypothetical protein
LPAAAAAAACLPGRSSVDNVCISDELDRVHGRKEGRKFSLEGERERERGRKEGNEKMEQK